MHKHFKYFVRVCESVYVPALFPYLFYCFNYDLPCKLLLLSVSAGLPFNAISNSLPTIFCLFSGL